MSHTTENTEGRDWAAEAAHRTAELESGGEELRATARTHGWEDLEAEMTRRIAELKATKTRLSMTECIDSKAHKRLLRSVVPRRTPPSRPAARRPAARRSLGARSSQDPGAGEDDPHDGPGTFASFHRSTLGLTGAERLAIFSALPEDLAAIYWDNLAREIDGGAE
jgi:hypothetical protein